MSSIPDISIVPTCILSDKRMTYRALKVYIAIKSFMNKETHECYPSRQLIARIADIPVTRVSVETEFLEQLGWIKKKGTGGRSMACTYTVFSEPQTVTKSETVINSVTVTKSETVTESDKTVTDLSENGYRFGMETVINSVTGKQQTIEHTKNIPVEHTRAADADVPVDLLQEPITESLPSPKKPKTDYSSEFDEVWKIYPAGCGGIKPKKQDAFRCYGARRKEGATTEQLLTATINYREFCDKKNYTGVNYVLNASTFFGPNKEFENYATPTEIKSNTPQQSRRLEPSSREELLASKDFLEDYFSKKEAGMRKLEEAKNAA